MLVHSYIHTHIYTQQGRGSFPLGTHSSKVTGNSSSVSGNGNGNDAFDSNTSDTDNVNTNNHSNNNISSNSNNSNNHTKKIKKNKKKIELPPLADYVNETSDSEAFPNPLSKRHTHSAPDTNMINNLSSPPRTARSEYNVINAISKARERGNKDNKMNQLSKAEINLFNSPFAHDSLTLPRISSPLRSPSRTPRPSSSSSSQVLTSNVDEFSTANNSNLNEEYQDIAYFYLKNALNDVSQDNPSYSQFLGVDTNVDVNGRGQDGGINSSDVS